MRYTILFSTVLVPATFSAGLVMAGDRYGPPEPIKPATVSTADWNGPLLNWTNKPTEGAVASRSTAPAPAKPAWSNTQRTVVPPRPANATSTPAAALPTSIYAPATMPASTPVAAEGPAASEASSAIQPAHPTGQVLTLSLADLPTGPSLERQEAAEDEAAVLAAQVARANALAAKDIAAGKPVTGGSTTDLLGGP